MYYRLLVLGISLLLVGSNVLASGLRVNTISFPGLIDDEETDISLNPAALGNLKSSRIYTGGSLFNADDNAYGTYTAESKAGYFEYIWPIGHTWTGVKYEPSLNSIKSNHDDYSYENKESNNNLLIHAGVPISKKTDFGVSISRYSSVISRAWKDNLSWEGESGWNDWDDEQIETEKYREYQLDIGFLYRTSRYSHTGIVISGISRQWEHWAANYASNVMAVTLYPEWALTKRNILKSVFKYQFYRFGGDLYTTGLAWNYKYGSKILFALTALCNWNYAYHNFNGIGYFKAGIEKEIIKKLKARASLTYNTENMLKHIDSLAFGLGYKPIDRIAIDLGFRKLQDHYYDHNQEIGIAGTYYFAVTP